MVAIRRSSSAMRLTRNWVFTRARTSGALTGLAMKSAAPSSKPETSKAGSLWLVTKITGRRDQCGVGLELSQTSKPLMTGHLGVEQHQIRSLLARQSKRIRAIMSQSGGCRTRQDTRHQLNRRGVVVDQQDVLSHRGKLSNMCCAPIRAD